MVIFRFLQWLRDWGAVKYFDELLFVSLQTKIPALRCMKLHCQVQLKPAIFAELRLFACVRDLSSLMLIAIKKNLWIIVIFVIVRGCDPLKSRIFCPA